ncbi:potassium channel family protein [Halodesulfovibrio aestuarii]|uniref:TrkA family potassium uptake protein n=1 Tax=Halodesulfovibrio aestuarii TaxID=126333 RepID=A0ABV4JWF0_9BACT
MFTSKGVSSFQSGGFSHPKALFEDGNEVVAMDSNKVRVQAIDAYSTEAIVIDATNRESLKALGLGDMDGVIVSTGTQISISILICLYLNEIGVKQILVKALDDDHAEILRRIGVTQVIHPERDSAVRVSRSLSRPNILDFIPLADEYDLAQVEAPRDFIKKNLKELNLRAKYNVHIIAIKERSPENFMLVPPADFTIKADDILILLGKTDDIKKIKALKQ